MRRSVEVHKSDVKIDYNARAQVQLEISYYDVLFCCLEGREAIFFQCSRAPCSLNPVPVMDLIIASHARVGLSDHYDGARRLQPLRFIATASGVFPT